MTEPRSATRTRTSAELRASVEDAGFTPSLRDVAALAELLADREDAVARNAERALARVGVPVVARITAVAKTASPPVRAGIARLLGRFVAEAAVPAWLVAALGDDDARVRRAAARALGKGARGGDADSATEGALLAALERSDDGSERRAIAEALGKVGAAPALEKLRALRTDDAELARVVAQAIMMLARDAARPEADAERIATDVATVAPVHVILRCRDGLEELLREEIAEKATPALRVDDRARETGAVHALLAGPLGSLSSLRLMMSFGFELLRRPVPEATAAKPRRGRPDGTTAVKPRRGQNDEGAHQDEAERGLIEAMTSPLAKELLETFTRGPVRYRIAWGGGGHRRAAVWRCARAIAQARPGWINDPTSSDWEVLAHEPWREVVVELCPRSLPDARFDYRRRDVPGASHPTIAAALARVAGVRADDVVWDPFAGSGTELVERAFAGPYARLIGSDLEERALSAARENLAAAGLRGVLLSRADATTYAPEGVTLVLTNPPMGRRVSRSAELAATLDAFVDHAARVLVPGGRMVWLSPVPARSRERAKLGGLVLEAAREVDMGGFTAELQKLVKR